MKTKLLLLLFLLPGCTRYQKFLTDDTARQIAVSDFGTVIRGTLLALKPSEAREEAHRITRIAQRIKDTAQGDVTISDFRSAITSLVIQRLDPEDRPRAMILTELIVGFVKARFNVDLTVIPDELFPLTREFVIQLCDEAIAGAGPYSQ